jgi:hypothetical protein
MNLWHPNHQQSSSSYTWHWSRHVHVYRTWKIATHGFLIINPLLWCSTMITIVVDLVVGKNSYNISCGRAQFQIDDSRFATIWSKSLSKKNHRSYLWLYMLVYKSNNTIGIHEWWWFWKQTKGFAGLIEAQQHLKSYSSDRYDVWSGWRWQMMTPILIGALLTSKQKVTTYRVTKRSMASLFKN